MYAKIQKGNSQSYMLIHSDAQITLNARAVTSEETWDYMCQQQATEGKCGDDSTLSGYVANLLRLLGVESGQPFIVLYETDRVFFYGSNDMPDFKMRNVSLACVNIDGVNYITEGNVYVLNDKGQTIQKI
jgi:hypothetical protein